MSLEEIRKYCLRKPGATEDIKWGQDLCFNVGGKMFFVSTPDRLPVSASFKADPDNFESLTQREGIIPAPYLARYKWVYVDDLNRLTKQDWFSFIDLSYEQVFSKLPAKVRNQVIGVQK
jgi:predicted DNA-binding protein (MmcQ/YjbR family)